jgi:hypothetical protein
MKSYLKEQFPQTFTPGIFHCVASIHISDTDAQLAKGEGAGSTPEIARANAWRELAQKLQERVFE